MSAEQLTRALCKKLPLEELEELFWSGPSQAYTKPTQSVQEAWDVAKDMCLDCPVFVQCLEGHMGWEFGVWAGTDQYERYKKRRALSKALLAGPWEGRKEIAARVHRMRQGAYALSHPQIAREVGLTAPAVKKLVEEYEVFLGAAKKEEPVKSAYITPPERERIVALRAIGLTPLEISRETGRHVTTVRNALLRWQRQEQGLGEVQPFPAEMPDGDGWVRNNGLVCNAHYVAQTEDGAWLRMKLKPGIPVIKWMHSSDVDLRRPITVQIQSWQGRPKSDRKQEGADAEAA